MTTRPLRQLEPSPAAVVAEVVVAVVAAVVVVELRVAHQQPADKLRPVELQQVVLAAVVAEVVASVAVVAAARRPVDKPLQAEGQLLVVEDKAVPADAAVVPVAVVAAVRSFSIECSRHLSDCSRGL